MVLENRLTASQGVANTPAAVAELKGDDARAAFVKQFKEVQRLQNQLTSSLDEADAYEWV
jgi:type I restriction enzyme R subunit